MNPILQAALGSILRWALAILAGFLVKAKIWSSSEAENYVAAAAIAILVLLWSIWSKYRTRIKFLTALTMPVGATENDVIAKAKAEVTPTVFTPANTVPGVPDLNKPTTPPAMPLTLFLLCLLPMFMLVGCSTPKLEPGGAYAPTNSVGVVVYTDTGLALADASYKFAYDTCLAPLRFERENRTKIMELSPTVGKRVKLAMDVFRKQVWEVDKRWALARSSYRQNPTPVGLTTLQTILSEINRIAPSIQAALVPVSNVIATTP